MFVINRNGEANSAKCDQSTVRPDRVIWICDATTSNDDATISNHEATISNDDATTSNDDAIARERDPFIRDVESVSLDRDLFKRKRLPALLRRGPDNPSGESSICECELFRPEPEPADSRPEP